MRLGVLLPQTEIGPDPAVLQRFAEAAEAAGFSYLSLYDHVLGVDPAAHPTWSGPYAIADQFHEALVVLGWLAGRCSLALATGVLVLPQRQTALVAKQAAEVDVLCGGRLRLGVGIGWNPVEYEGLGVDFSDRAERFEEQVHVLRRLWTEDVVSFAGSYHTLSAVGIRPRPVQQPVPLWMGGGSTGRSRRRIGRLADGWMALALPGRGLEPMWEEIQAAASAAGRPDGAVGLEGTAQPGPTLGRLTRQVARWEQAGATHLTVSGLGAGRSPEEHVAFVTEAGRLLFD